MTLDDTIVAISSATGPAARMILRLTGPNAFALCASLVNQSLPEFPSKSNAQRTHILFSGLSVPAWVLTFAAPKSYTTQDVVEFHIPGNVLLSRLLLDHLLAAGARLAEPGEFTARAFFNGKIDLSQAEGISATIAAQSREQLDAARQLLSGELSRRLRPTMELLAETLALVEADIDFAEEGIQSLSTAQIQSRIDSCIDQLNALISQSSRFGKLTHEPTIVLAGLPNAGKSTLTNAMAGRPRSIVSARAGTTRDLLSVEISLPRGIARLIDIAGLEDAPTTDASPAQRTIDEQMQHKARQAMEEADVLVLVRDSTCSQAPPQLPRNPDLVVFSKADLSSTASREPGEALWVSAVTGANMNILREALDRLTFADDVPGASLALTARHVQSIEEAVTILLRAEDQPASPEITAAELRAALNSLGQILGLVTPDDILGKIFATFCIGK